MQQDPIWFWKNYRLGTELHVSGTFIYNALYIFDQIEHFYYEHEVFEFLYNIAVGIERLEKIAVILIHHDPSKDQEQFERELITHNHLDLLDRIKKSRSINLGKKHNKFLQLIQNFYRTTRYGRYNLNSVYSKNQDVLRFVDFLKKEFQVEETEGLTPMVLNSLRIKTIIGKLVGKIVTELFKVIRHETSRLGIFTHEIQYNSKAYKIFTEKSFTFEQEKHLQKEIIVLLLSGKLNDGCTKFIKEIKPLAFDAYSSDAYISYLMNIRKNGEVIDEMESILEDDPMNADRREAVGIIGLDNLNFDEDDGKPWTIAFEE